MLDLYSPAARSTKSLEWLSMFMESFPSNGVFGRISLCVSWCFHQQKMIGTTNDRIERKGRTPLSLRTHSSNQPVKRSGMMSVPVLVNDNSALLPLC